MKLVQSFDNFLNETAYPRSRGGSIRDGEEVGRMDVKMNGVIVGTLVFYVEEDYFAKDGSYRAGASYTIYPYREQTGGLSDGSTGSGFWGIDCPSKEEAIKACKDMMKKTKLS